MSRHSAKSNGQPFALCQIQLTGLLSRFSSYALQINCLWLAETKNYAATHLAYEDGQIKVKIGIPHCFLEEKNTIINLSKQLWLQNTILLKQREWIARRRVRTYLVSNKYLDIVWRVTFNSFVSIIITITTEQTEKRPERANFIFYNALYCSQVFDIVRYEY